MGEKQGFMTSVVALASQKWGVGGDWPLGRGMGGMEASFVPFESLRLAGLAPFQSSETASTAALLKPYGTRPLTFYALT